LNGAVAIIPFEEALMKILIPLQRQVGQLWHDGRLGIATERYVTKQVQQKIFAAMNQLPIHQQGPKVVVACPAGQMHEIGAQTIAYRCGARGCRVYYLGSNSGRCVGCSLR
jgi:methanogenic corrinoid protein MtbC1